MSSDITEPQEIFVPEYLELQEILLEHERAHWNVDEADMRVDVEQWKNGKMTDGNKAFIKMILRLFTQADTNVCFSYVERLLPIFKAPDARMMLLSFANREVTHMLGYKRLNDTLGYDTKEFSHEFLSYAAMKSKHDFMVEKMPLDTPLNIAIYVARQALFEGVSLFGPFSQLLSFAANGKVPGMVSVNLWSIAEESLHFRGLSTLLRIYLQQHPEVVGDVFKKSVYETYGQIIAFEDACIDLAFSVGENENATPEQSKQYVRYIGDYRMTAMGFKPQYNIEDCPMPVVEQVTGNVIGNFFEKTVTEYSKDSLSGSWSY